MALFDLALPELEKYCPRREEPTDFDQFWNETLSATRRHELAPSFEQVDVGLSLVDTYDVTFRGYAGQPVKAWLVLPRGRSGKLPCIVEYIGYGGGRGFPFDWLLWPSAGYAALVMDTRGQGSGWRGGETVDLAPEGSAPHVPGHMTLGILDKEQYYYRRVFADAVRAVETARAHTAIDPERIAVAGGSQGGGIGLAVSGLDPSVVLGLHDVPFLCHYRRATEISDADPYNEISRYCKIHRDKIERVFTTLSYFDGVHFAARARCRALFSVALMDAICPPSTVYAAYNHHAGQKSIRVYPYNGHEGGEGYHTLERLRFVADAWGAHRV